ncbi:hypothetical protein HOV23_gp099 [Pseudomonas phage Lana]|uniref:Uncharacterized protein n=1 Tax=Pseudomonas phage Lana TaxID=2530172 RepID=A0A481W5W0_9CAUD|nr:hypothetical protein HOV23_gp099 [Pseudomonas phage Lana]QBJ04474.1 hypothetical protein [Pseudomonas phage Lana]
MSRGISATLYRGRKKDKVWTRYYSWMDTAMPRAVQLTLQTGEEGDVVEFASTELGFQIGVLHVRPRNRLELEYSPLVKSSPSLMKLLGGDV